MKCAKTNGQDDGLIFKMVLPEMMRYIYNVKKKNGVISMIVHHPAMMFNIDSNDLEKIIVIIIVITCQMYNLFIQTR